MLINKWKSRKDFFVSKVVTCHEAHVCYSSTERVVCHSSRKGSAFSARNEKPDSPSPSSISRQILVQSSLRCESLLTRFRFVCRSHTRGEQVDRFVRVLLSSYCFSVLLSFPPFTACMCVYMFAWPSFPRFLWPSFSLLHQKSIFLSLS